jgi:hypothetical protein
MFSASKSGKVAGVAVDPQFNYVTALLHGDGTNGAQNNTFLDSSTNNFTITRNGTPTQGSFSPYGSLWSDYFVGANAYLSGNNAIIGSSTSTFTVEAFIFMTSAPTADANGLPVLVGLDAQAANTASYMVCGVTTAQKVALRWFDGAGKTCTGSTTIPLNTWTHIAIVVNSNAITLYVNGVSETLSGTTTLTSRAGTTSVSVIGSHYYSTFYGYASNIRVSSIARTITVPTSPYTSDANTLVLASYTNNFNSAGTTSITWTTGSAGPSVQRFNPFLPTSSQAYSTSVYGGSAYFTGSGDYLGTTTSSSGFTFGTGDFTIEMWVNWSQFANAPSNEPGVFQTSTTSGGLQTTYLDGVLLFITSGYFNVICGTTFAGRLTSNSAPNFNTWYHVAIVRSSGTLTIYVNGVNAGSQSNTSNLTATYAAIGGYYSSSYSMNGYVSNFRVVKGTAVYTANFTPPTSPLTAITNTQFLVNMTNAGIYDNAMINDLITVGSTQVSTSVKKYGTGSILLNGTTDYLTFPNVGNPQFNFGVGDFTIEFWINSTDTAGGIITPLNSYGGTYWGLLMTSSTFYWQYSYGVSNLYNNSASSILNGAWHHVAIVRYSGTNKMYFDGVAQTNSSSDTTYYTSPSLSNYCIGYDYSGGGNTGYLSAYIDDFRVTKGYARYTANFTPPTAALPNYGR